MKIDSDDYSGRTCDIFLSQIEILKQILSQSIPLIPEIERAFDAGWGNNQLPFSTKNKREYISNLKLDI